MSSTRQQVLYSSFIVTAYLWLIFNYMTFTITCLFLFFPFFFFFYPSSFIPTSSQSLISSLFMISFLCTLVKMPTFYIVLADGYGFLKRTCYGSPSEHQHYGAGHRVLTHTSTSPSWWSCKGKASCTSNTFLFSFESESYS